MYKPNMKKTKKAYLDYKDVEKLIFEIDKELDTLIERRRYYEKKKREFLENYIKERNAEAKELGCKCQYCKDTGYTVSLHDDGHSITSCSCGEKK